MGEGTLAKRKRVATLKAPGGPPGALPGAPEAPEAAGSASKGKEGRVWQEALMPCRGGAEAEETGRHTRGEPSSNFTSDSWIPEKDFEGSLVHIPRIIPFQGAPRQSTLSVALPASIVANAQSLEMKAALVGQVARTLTIMGVDEVVVYEDEASAVDPSTRMSPSLSFFLRNLQYLETPQFLRKRLFKLHPDLKFAGLQNPLDAPHHLRRSEWLPYREGVVTEGAPSEGGGCLVDCGLAHPVECLQQIPPGTRVTLRLHPGMRGVGDGSTLSPRQRKAIFRGEAVSSQEPPERAGLYWGYRVRAASSLRGVFSGHNLSSESRGLYDCLVGTSERGLPLEDVAPSLQAGSYKHLLVVFGGLKGLEAAVRDSQSEICPSVARQATHHCLEGDRGDTSAAEVRRACRRVAQQAGPGGPLEAFAKGETEALPPSCLFDYFVNTCPLQASRTIRAEEALLVSLAAIRQAGIHSRGPPKHQDETMRVECVKGKKRRPHVPPLIRVMLELQAKSQKQ